jgi:hypothetical protein
MWEKLNMKGPSERADLYKDDHVSYNIRGKLTDGHEHRARHESS